MPIDPIEEQVEAVETPIAAEPEAPPAKVTFTDEQKVKISAIMKEVSARAGSEARSELARLKASLPVEPQSTDTALRLAETQAELTALKSEAHEAKLQAVLLKAVSTENFFDNQLASEILRASTRMIDGKVTIVAADGTPRLNSEFSPMTPAELARELGTSKPFLVRSNFKPGLGSIVSTNPPATVKLEEIFGASSNSGLANKIAMSDPSKYRRMRAQAVQAGLLRG